MLTAADLEAVLVPSPDAPGVALGVDLAAADCPLTRHACAPDEAVASLLYPSVEAYSRRVSLDVDALRVVAGHAVVGSWTVERTGAAPVVCMRYAPAPTVEAPAPIAPVAHHAPPRRQR